MVQPQRPTDSISSSSPPPLVPPPVLPQARGILADPTLAAAFRADGYIKTTLLSPDEAGDLRAELDAMRALADVPHGEVAGGAVDYHCSAMDPNIVYRRRLNAHVRARLEARVTSLLDGYRLLYATLYVKRDGLGTFPMHYNWPILSDLNDTSVTVWLPLVATDGDSGGVRVVPGSHKLAPHINGPRTPAFYDETAPTLSARAIGPALQPGEVMIFDDCVIHGSSPNRSGKLRPALQLICVPRDALPVFYHDRRDGSFEMVHADSNFWIDTDFAALTSRQPEWQGLGLVRSRNRRVSLDTLDGLIANGARIRAAGFAPAEATTPQSSLGKAVRQSWWRRALTKIRL